MKNTYRHYRQGDVFIERIASIPSTATKVDKANHDRIILAFGEVTGHHHSLDIDAADWWKSDDGQNQFIDVHDHPVIWVGLPIGNAQTKVAKSIKSGALVVHQEHRPIALPPGKYKVSIQREYHPKEIRRVQD